MLRRLDIIFLIIGLGFFSHLQAAQELPIYRAFGSVKNQTDTERNIAASLYFGEVIVRASGRRDALTNPVILAAIPKASSYLFSFSYTGNKIEIVEGKPQTRIGIQLDYSPQAVNQLLKSAQLPLWPAQRPKVLVWTAYRDVALTELHRVPDETVMNQLQLQSGLRGLKMQMPEWDLDDSLAVSVEHVWQLNLEKIKAASARYKADVIVVARYQPVSMGRLPPGLLQDDAASVESDSIEQTVSSVEANPVVNDAANVATETVNLGPWVMDWQVVNPATQQSSIQSEQAAEAAALFANFTHKLADQLSSQYSVTLGQQTAQTYYMQISNIRHFAAVKKSQAYLKTLAMVQKSELIKVNEQGLLLLLTMEGDSRLLESTLLLGKRLLPEFSPDVSAVDNPVHSEDENMPIDTNAPLENSGMIDSAEIIGPKGTLDDPLRYVWQEE